MRLVRHLGRLHLLVFVGTAALAAGGVGESGGRSVREEGIVVGEYAFHALMVDGNGRWHVVLSICSLYRCRRRFFGSLGSLLIGLVGLLVVVIVIVVVVFLLLR